MSEEEKAELTELYENSEWWHNRFNAVERDNRQLKGILQEIYERAINTNITSLDFRDYILEILGDKENGEE